MAVFRYRASKKDTDLTNFTCKLTIHFIHHSVLLLCFKLLYFLCVSLDFSWKCNKEDKLKCCPRMKECYNCNVQFASKILWTSCPTLHFINYLHHTLILLLQIFITIFHFFRYLSTLPLSLMLPAVRPSIVLRVFRLRSTYLAVWPPVLK